MQGLPGLTLGLAFLASNALNLGAQGSVPDPANLPLGDGRISSAPLRGSVWSCSSQFGGGGGAHLAGSWIRDDGTYDFTAKPTVDGTVEWPHSFSVSLDGNARRVTGNDLPDHPTGHFPIAGTDDAFRYDRNPNSIRAQSVVLDLPAAPAVPAQASCLPMGPVGVLLSGSYFFNALDLRGDDAVAHEIQDGCQGHPQATGAYHYHNLSSCVTDAGTSHSALVGYAFDGFGIFGKRGEDGRQLTNADLDECHGHAHTIEWDGRRTEMYHYHATWEYPYTLGCFRGAPAHGTLLDAGQGRGRERRAAPAGDAPAPPLPANGSTTVTDAFPAGADRDTGSASLARLSAITLGSGSPRYDSLRSGPATAIRIDDRVVLVDAGNGTQGRLQQAGIQLEQLDALLITHHHLDHDQELIPLVITSLVRGLTPEIVGAPGTVRMIGFMKEFYREDIAYRAGRSPGADVNPDSLRVRDVDGGETLSIAGATVRTAQVQHTIHTVAYRFDVGSESIVVSGDLTYSASLVDLARGADVLVVDSGNLPGPDGLTGRAGGRGGGRGAAPPGGRGAPGGRGMRGGRAAGSFQPQAARAHPSLAEIASMATQAGVPCIVLTHINRTEVDEAATLELFRPLYSGKVIVASDMLETTSGCATSGAA